MLKDLKAYTEAHMPGYSDWRVVEGFRTAKYQHSLYEQGRTKPGPIVTMRDGIIKKSNHQTSLAVDFVPFKSNGKPDWGVAIEHWAYLGHVARAHGLEWGGDWKKFLDKPHVEWPPSDKATYTAASKWQKANGLA